MPRNEFASVHPALALLFALSLAACGSKKPPETAPAPEPVKPVVQGYTVPTDSIRHKIIETATEEWIFFGQQRVVIEETEESIPHVGIWEDDDWAHSERVNRYWRTAGMGRLTGYDCKEPWSAAFISWVMQEVGVPSSLFPPAPSHRDYLSRIMALGRHPEAVLIPHTIQEYIPKPGDLICANRGQGYFGDAIEELPASLNAKLHCDIVVENDGKTLQAIGGNVRNSVSKSILTLSPDGHLQLTKHRPWFLIVENRLD